MLNSAECGKKRPPKIAKWCLKFEIDAKKEGPQSPPKLGPHRA